MVTLQPTRRRHGDIPGTTYKLFAAAAQRAQRALFAGAARTTTAQLLSGGFVGSLTKAGRREGGDCDVNRHGAGDPTKGSLRREPAISPLTFLAGGGMRWAWHKVGSLPCDSAGGRARCRSIPSLSGGAVFVASAMARAVGYWMAGRHPEFFRYWAVDSRPPPGFVQ